MNGEITIGNSYWHKRNGLKVWVKRLDEFGVFITQDVDGTTYLAYEGELEEIEE